MVFRLPLPEPQAETVEDYKPFVAALIQQNSELTAEVERLRDEVRELLAMAAGDREERDALARRVAALLAVVAGGRALLRERWKLRGWKGFTDAEILWLASADEAFVDSVVQPTEPAQERALFRDALEQVVEAVRGRYKPTGDLALVLDEADSLLRADHRGEMESQRRMEARDAKP